MALTPTAAASRQEQQRRRSPRAPASTRKAQRVASTRRTGVAVSVGWQTEVAPPYAKSPAFGPGSSMRAAKGRGTCRIPTASAARSRFLHFNAYPCDGTTNDVLARSVGVLTTRFSGMEQREAALSRQTERSVSRLCQLLLTRVSSVAVFPAVWRGRGDRHGCGSEKRGSLSMTSTHRPHRSWSATARAAAVQARPVLAAARAPNKLLRVIAEAAVRWDACTRDGG
jgi:hypothetical protein